VPFATGVTSTKGEDSPTTSSRKGAVQATVIEKYGVRAVIGKGGMGGKALASLKKSSAMYLNAIGGAAQLHARTVDKVLGGHLTEFGIPRRCGF
jgi:fumarate hydratase, class I